MFVKAQVVVKWISEDEFKMVLVRLSDFCGWPGQQCGWLRQSLRQR